MQRQFEFATHGRCIHQVTREFLGWPREIGALDGRLTLFVRHALCSQFVQENADPDVPRDFLAWLSQNATSAGQASMRYLIHLAEGDDDMPAHLKAAILLVSVQVPVAEGRMVLGQRQGALSG